MDSTSSAGRGAHGSRCCASPRPTLAPLGTSCGGVVPVGVCRWRLLAAADARLVLGGGRFAREAIGRGGGRGGCRTGSSWSPSLTALVLFAATAGSPHAVASSRCRTSVCICNVEFNVAVTVSSDFFCVSTSLRILLSTASTAVPRSAAR